MAFYIGEPRQPSAYATGFRSTTGTPAGPGGRAYPLSGSWRPGSSYIANHVSAQNQARSERLNNYFRMQRLGGPYPQFQETRPDPALRWQIPWWEAAGMNKGEFDPKYEGREYLGGYSDDYVSAARVRDEYGSDNLSQRYHAYQARPPMRETYGQPLYRKGDEQRFPALQRLGVDGIRQWQGFFQANGFKTGPSGFWTEFEMNAMRSFMIMANGVPGGGMDVNVLRARVAAQVQSGELRPYELATILPETAINEQAAAEFGAGAGGGAGEEDLQPYTETTVQRRQQEFDTGQGLMLIRAELARSIGRAPTKTEIARYVKALNAAMRADPDVVTTVVTTNPATGRVDRTVTEDPTSVSPEGMAAEFAAAPSAERTEYQASRYIEAMMNELGL